MSTTYQPAHHGSAATLATRFPYLILFLVTCVCAFGGQSIVLQPNFSGTIPDPAEAISVDTTVEFQVHGITYPVNPNQPVFDLEGAGVRVLLQPYGTGRVDILPMRDGVIDGAPCALSLASSGNYLFRIRRDHTALRFTCEVWNFDGSGYLSQVLTITSLGAGRANASTLGGGGSASLGFLRVLPGLTAFASKPPTTAQSGSVITELKFDGSLGDASGNGHTASAFNATYTATPNQVAAAVSKTFNAPRWSNWGTLRAGFPAKLDGTASYSLADQSSNVTYFWQELDGPSTVIWDDRHSGTPTITGLIFGTYTFRLRVTDVAGNSAETTLQVGAVATDEKGVIVNADPAVSQIFGDMIVYNSNPWSWEDNRHFAAVNGQIAYFPSAWVPHLTWTTPGAGTVSYPFAGIGPTNPGITGTTLASGLTATSQSIAIADASKVPGLARLPTWIMIGDSYFSQEIVRVVATTATSGAATLTVAYDGRGISGTGINGFAGLPAQAWSTGVHVGEYRIQGTGTSFVSDSQRPLCPAGAPGPPGAVVFSSGTVTLTANSATVTGTGTNWISANHVTPGDWIRVSATHGGGTPFVWWAYINAVGNAATLTASRPAPADVDGTGFQYAITSPRYISLEFAAPNGSTQRALQNLHGCESETAAFGGATHDIAQINQSVFSGVHYSYKDTLGAATNTFGPNFYGSGLALRSFYYRSGYTPALTAANLMDDNWARDPELCGGYCGGLPLTYGGGSLGAAVNAALNKNAVLAWPDVGGFVENGAFIASLGCNIFDTRDSSAMELASTLAATYDPDSTRKAHAQTILNSVLAREQNCSRADKSWANTANFQQNAPALPLLTLSTGSATVTGSGFAPSMCMVTNSATVNMRKGKAAFTGIGLADGSKITVTGRLQGQTYVGIFSFTQSGGSTGTLGALWPGDSGIYSAVIENGDDLTSIGTDGNDPMLREAWACTFVDSGHLTLNRPWDGPSGSSYRLDHYVIPGYDQQPFMLGGYKSNVLRLGKLNPATSSGFGSLLTSAGIWLHDFGYDPNSQGMSNERVFGYNPDNNVTGACEPQTTQSSDTVITRTPNCQIPSSTPLDAVRAARALAAEGGLGLMYWYVAGPSLGRRHLMDTVYGSLWGSCDFTAPGFYCDGKIPVGENSDASLASFKWPGFFFGMGGFFSNSWPAVRLGGVSPARNRTVYINFNLGAAASAQVVVTAPSELAQTFTCTAAPCAVTVDDRQGSHWFQIRYLSGTGKVLASSTPDLLSGPIQ